MRRDCQTVWLSWEADTDSAADLLQKFVWNAKRDKLKKQGIDPIRAEKEAIRRRQVELKDEVSAVKARRDDREEEKEQWQREQRRLQV